MTECNAYQLLVEAHLLQILLENLRVHVGALLTNIPVPVDFWINTLTPCGQLFYVELAVSMGIIAAMP